MVVVALIQMRTLKAEVEKGSVTTSIVYGLLGPNAMGKSIDRIYSLQKGNQVNIPEDGLLSGNTLNSETSVYTPRRVLFSS